MQTLGYLVLAEAHREKAALDNVHLELARAYYEIDYRSTH